MPTTRFPGNPARPTRRRQAGRAGCVALAFLALGLPAGIAQEAQEANPFDAVPDLMRRQIELELRNANGRARIHGNLQMGRNALDLQFADDFGDGEGMANILEGASVKTDSEMEDLLQRAGEFAEAGRYDLSALLWQEVVDRSGDIVFTKDEWIRKTLQQKYQRYRGITSEIERTLAALPPEGLAAYRTKADGEARGILRTAGDAGREAALGEVVRRYFLSVIGDDAAFELACLKLDRFEFLPAARLLSKVLREYPEPTVARDDILIRLAVASGRLGDVAAARALLEEADAGTAPAEVVALVRADVEASAGAAGAMLAGSNDGRNGWRMAGGNPARSGMMAAPPEAILASGGGLGVAWKQGFKLTLPENWPTEPNFEIDPYERASMATAITGIRFGQAVDDSQDGGEVVREPTLGEKWRAGDWMPTGQMLVSGDKVYFKTHYQVVCADARTGMPKWLGFRNIFPLDSISNIAGMYRGNLPDTGAPTTMEEVELFADHVHQGMCLAGDVLVTLEGQLSDFAEEKKPDPRQFDNRINRFRFNLNASNNRARGNRLVAYHAHSGKLRWSRYSGDGIFVDGDTITFAGPPVPYGGLLLAPVNIGGALWLHAFSVATGETLWKAFLANEPGGGCSPYSPVMVAVSGGDAYVASGAGLVFSVDAVSGALNWATRYSRASRSMTMNDMMGRMRGSAPSLDGWQQDQVIPHGSALVFVGSDFDQMAAFDRRSGELLWETPRVPSEEEPASTYVLGTMGGDVFVAGPEVVRAYRIQGGRFLWETKIERSFARGMVTPEGIYVPQASSIVRLAPESGEITHRLPVTTGEDEPVGNLFSDGRHVLAFGLRAIHALSPTPEDAPAAPKRGDGPEGNAPESNPVKP